MVSAYSHRRKAKQLVSDVSFQSPNQILPYVVSLNVKAKYVLICDSAFVSKLKHRTNAIGRIIMETDNNCMNLLIHIWHWSQISDDVHV